MVKSNNKLKILCFLNVNLIYFKTFLFKKYEKFFLYTLYTKIFHNRVEKILAHIINKIIINKNSKIIIIDIGAFRGEFSKKIFLILKNMQFLNFNFFLVDPNPNFIKYLTSNNIPFRYNCENIAISSERVGGIG